MRWQEGRERVETTPLKKVGQEGRQGSGKVKREDVGLMEGSKGGTGAVGKAGQFTC